MIKNILLAVVLALGTATLFAPRRSPKKPISPTSPTKLELSLKIGELKANIKKGSLSPSDRSTTLAKIEALRRERNKLA